MPRHSRQKNGGEKQPRQRQSGKRNQNAKGRPNKEPKRKGNKGNWLTRIIKKDD